MKWLCLFLIILLSGFVSAQSSGNTCSSSDDVILRLSASSNAHGEIFSATGTYPIDVCYSSIFGSAYTGVNPHACATNNANIVLRLSASSNAHGEIPDASSPVYTTNVCYGNLVCHSVAGNINCPSGEQEIISLSRQTNAQLEKASANIYTASSNYKICCSTSSGSPPVIPGSIASVGWVYSDGQPISAGTLFCPNSFVYAYAITSGISDGTSLTFKFYEEDILVNDLLFEISVPVQNNLAYFPVNFVDTNVQNLLLPYLDGNNNDAELMFKAEIGTNSVSSNIIKYTEPIASCTNNPSPPVVTTPILRCEDFVDSNACNSNANPTYPQNSYGAQQPACTSLKCYWISDSAGCGVRVVQYPSIPQSGCNPTGNPVSSCAWTTTQSECLNRVRTITYTADPSNTPNCPIMNTNSVTCNLLNFELDFFGIPQFISSALIIVLLYAILGIKKNETK